MRQFLPRDCKDELQPACQRAACGAGPVCERTQLRQKKRVVQSTHRPKQGDERKAGLGDGVGGAAASCC